MPRIGFVVNTFARMLVVAAAASASLVACSTQSGPSTSTRSLASTSSGPCALLTGRPVGGEIAATKPTGRPRLANPPRACAAAATISDAVRCHPRHNGVRDGYVFFYWSRGLFAFGRPGQTWHVKDGGHDLSPEARQLGC